MVYFSGQKFKHMIKSMTGYGKAECELSSKKVTVEIKSLNSKQLDINSRISSIYREKDLEIRRIISEKIVRGKIDFCLYCEQLGDTSSASINKPIVMEYINQMTDIYKEFGFGASETMIQSVMRLPDAVKVEHEELDEEEWNCIVKTIGQAIDQLVEFRVQEGRALEIDMLSHIDKIESLRPMVDQFDKERIAKIKAKLEDAFKDISTNIQADPNRFEQELIFYLEKLDINEEKVRLANHCKYFRETLNDDFETGKKLGFIAQEIGREINTMGSKANNSDIQKIVIQMKDELEKIKEQSLNVL